MDALRGRVALRAVQQLGVAPNLEIKASLGRVQVHLDYFPRCHQAQRAGEQRLHSNTHFTPRSWAPAARMDAAIVGVGFHTKRHRAQTGPTQHQETRTRRSNDTAVVTNSDSHFKQINNLQRLVSNSGGRLCNSLLFDGRPHM